jgi:large subunit ribosomal protein L25
MKRSAVGLKSAVGARRQWSIPSQIFARDLQLSGGARVLLDDDALVVHLTHAPTAEEVDAELAGAEADAGIERDAPEAAVEEGAGEPAGDQDSADE